MSALLLGVGNLLLTDEAIGVETVNQFLKQYDYDEKLNVLDGGTSGMELLDYLANRELVIIVDAVLSKENSAGDIIILEDKQVPMFFSQKISPHQVGICDVLSALVMTDELPKKLILIGAVPLSVEVGIGLTDKLTGRVQPILVEVEFFLKKYGLFFKRKAK